jgi:non-canonical purine NTP pyrophosphatase (RdgB/HAM1 family)
MTKLIFATTNQGKLIEVRRILNVPVESTALEIEEIQSTDPVKVATHKALAYFSELKQPLFIEDASLAFAALNGLPGTYINDFVKTLGNTGLADLLDGKNDKTATAQVTMVYVDGVNDPQVFTGRVQGKIVKPQGEGGFGWDPIFVPLGATKTFAEMSNEEKDQFSMRRQALEAMRDWLVANKKI